MRPEGGEKGGKAAGGGWKGVGEKEKGSSTRLVLKKKEEEKEEGREPGKERERLTADLL